MDFTKTSVRFFFVLILTISSSNVNILAKPAIDQASYNCIGPCMRFYGNMKCYNDCISKHYDGGQCDSTRGGKFPQCCCYNYKN
ncbi:hypothetical protein EUTSA_v10029133mg [Eutrema salsugineum]|uniref:Defensin-like domain-containing protein n=1 Tax=Eutrema salsugineum TaxID=72664 RepID=V4LFV8_EUTSA|nr:putative defensin-like protein 62 [Eutrema salsugineum]ESQ38638.1 hypothetical protein EUTSA_v10029133mg [Eutrema salsugineum]